MTRTFAKSIIRTAGTVAVTIGLLTPNTSSAQSHSAYTSQAAAIEACAGYNDYGPVSVVAAVDDGMNDTLVWLRKRNGDLWMCNADSIGNVYFKVLIDGDRLDGEGFYLAGINQSSFGNARLHNPAEQLCVSMLEGFGSTLGSIINTVPDGMGDYLVWLETNERELWACNASADYVLYAFVEIKGPINGNVHHLPMV